MFSLEVNQNRVELSNAGISRQQIVENGLIPTSSVFNETERATLESKEGDRVHKVTIERILI